MNEVAAIGNKMVKGVDEVSAPGMHMKNKDKQEGTTFEETLSDSMKKNESAQGKEDTDVVDEDVKVDLDEEGSEEVDEVTSKEQVITPESTNTGQNQVAVDALQSLKNTEVETDETDKASDFDKKLGVAKALVSEKSAPQNLDISSALKDQEGRKVPLVENVKALITQVKKEVVKGKSGELPLDEQDLKGKVPLRDVLGKLVNQETSVGMRYAFKSGMLAEESLVQTHATQSSNGFGERIHSLLNNAFKEVDLQVKSLLQDDSVELKDNKSLKPTLQRYFQEVDGFKQSKRLHIRLAAPLGGRVNLYLSETNGVVRAQMSAANDNVLEWIKDNIKSLKMIDAGVQVRWLPPQMEPQKSEKESQDKKEERKRREEGKSRGNKEQAGETQEVSSVGQGTEK